MIATGEMRDRGQTLQDFTVGIVLFILTVSAVITSFTGFISPIWTGVGSQEVSASERVSESIVRAHATGETPNQLVAEDLWTDVFSKSMSQLRTKWGLGDATFFRVVLEELDGTSVISYNGNDLAAGMDEPDGSNANTERLVTLVDSDACEPGCRLVVQVW
jgi:hypothetical protein